MIDIAAASTLSTILSSAVTTIKEARELAKSTTNLDLREKIGSAFDQLIDLREKLIEIDDENRALHKSLADMASFAGPRPPHGYVYRVGDDGHPLCPKCFQQKPSVIGYMSQPENWSGGIRRHCTICDWIVYEKPMDA